ncbi:hypothetical protein HZH68_016565 [Vespula germanica]|uniref:Uncharacterized protein n=1 Tax=Vespula germanica TaxID=30212 RepID=A0A834J2U6_VESGE|nr:hypothetical protein HZH68_016565 [Vespula germanica]
MKWGYFPTCDGNKVGSLIDFDSYWTNSHSAPSVDFDNLSPRVDLEIFAPLRVFGNLSPREDLEIFARSHSREYLRSADAKLHREVGILSPRDGNKVGSLIDFDSYWTSLALNFDECTSQLA